MKYHIYDAQEDGWAMIHYSACDEYKSRQGNKGWHGPYSAYQEALDAAASKKLGTVYPCKKCNPH